MRANVDLIKQKVAEADLAEALKLLATSVSNTDNENTVLLFQQRLNRLERDKKNGLIEDNYFETETNQLTISILDLLKTLKSDFVSNEMTIQPNLLFFESDFHTYTPVNERIFGQSFENTKTRAVAWELRMQFPALQFPLSVGLKWRALKADNTYSPYYSGDFTIPQNWSSYWLHRTYGYADFGKWKIGSYTIEVYIDEKLAGKGSFTIV